MRLILAVFAAILLAGCAGNGSVNPIPPVAQFHYPVTMPSPLP